ncbi:MAG: hydroxymethylbilane synthase, partial [Acidobacteriaceae bacterium]
MIRIGSRGSALARWQADHIAAELRDRGHQVSIEILVTTGDRVQHAPFMQVGTKGMFTKEIEEALADQRIDLAVHSLKDLPTELSEEFTIAAIPKRADPRDAFVSVCFESFAALPSGAVVGTSSLRRQAQLRALRADLDIRELRGNVDTRLRKLHQGQYEAIILAAAGLDRLGLAADVKELFSPQQM